MWDIKLTFSSEVVTSVVEIRYKFMEFMFFINYNIFKEFCSLDMSSFVEGTEPSE